MPSRSPFSVILWKLVIVALVGGLVGLSLRANDWVDSHCQRTAEVRQLTTYWKIGSVYVPSVQEQTKFICPNNDIMWR